jgi:SAM-dependent methyltransferase/uncharacterized protein YbaR (Trm112 family)
MRPEPQLMRLLRCPTCDGDLDLGRAQETASDGHVMTGDLLCLGCRNSYQILRGVPRFPSGAVSERVSQTVGGFGYQWLRANAYLRHAVFSTAEIFLEFIHPVEPDYFRGKLVLDAGCGMGRFTRLASAFGAAAVVGVDLSDSVDAAFDNTRTFSNVLILQADLFSLPLRPIFDYAFSVGVLHHTENPRRAFEAVLSLVLPGGGMSAWVYGRENNEWIIRFVNPVRRNVTSRMPGPLLLALAYAIATPLFFISKGLYRPVGKMPRLSWMKKSLFYFDYLFLLGGFGLREQACIVFDHLVPSIAEYIPLEAFTRWFHENGLRDVVISSRKGNSWRGFGRLPLQQN